MDKPSYQEFGAAIEFVDGELRWKINRKKGKIGQKVGSIDKYGYRTFTFKRQRFSAHRVTWLLCKGCWPLKNLDHKNGIRSDNRIENLREATTSQNAMNSATKPRKGPGGRGATLLPHGKWQAQIQVNGRNIYLGSFLTKEDAMKAYEDASRKHFGEFAFCERTP